MFGYEPILIVIPTLLGEGREPIAFGIVVVLHAVAKTHRVAEELAAYIERAVEERTRGRERPMYPHILGFGVGIVRPLGINHIATVRIKLVDVRPLLHLVRKEHDLIVVVRLEDAINAVPRVETAERIEMMVFVPALEDQGFIIDIPQPVRLDEGRLRQRHGIIEPVILRHDNAEL